MNYSAFEDYWNKCDNFSKKLIFKSNIRKRWFKNFYVLYQSKGWFTHDTWVMEYGKFNPEDYDGEYYGPFSKEDAEIFASQLKETKLNFILGG